MMDFKIQDMDIKVIKKDIKNIHLSVYPPDGQVRVSVPLNESLDSVRAYVATKLDWIKKKKRKILSQPREADREFINRESHYFNGQRYLLKIIEENSKPRVELSHGEIIVKIHPGADEFKKKSVLEKWYRQQISKSASILISQWEKKLNVSVSQFIIRKMKTKWGSCSPALHTIRLNLELAKKPPECLEYIIVHEMIHLLERRHNNHFLLLMNKHYPKWRYARDLLNSMPLSHQSWKYCDCFTC